MSADRILADVSVQQGWNVGTQLDLALRYIDTLGRDERPESFEGYLRSIAAEENGTTEETDVPDFVKDMGGKYFGGAYWHNADYRLIVKATSPTMFLLIVEDSSGAMAFEHEFTDTQADRLRDLVRTSEEADDEGLGLSRELHWRFEVDRTQVDLDLNTLDEIAEWIDTVFDAADGGN